MAKRAILQIKPKKKQLGRGSSRAFALKHLGKEPLLENDDNEGAYTSALNWYHAACEIGDARQYLEDYFKFHDREEDLKNIRKVPNEWICRTAAWIARMTTRGTVFSEARMKRFEDMLEHYCWRHIPKDQEKPFVISKTEENIRELIGDLEEIVDLRADLDGLPFSFLEWFKEKEVPRSYMEAVQVYYLEHLEELTDAYEGKDEQLIEAYPNREKLEYDILFIGELVEDVYRYTDETKVIREVKPRKPRYVAPEKKVRNLKYLRESEPYGISSVAPEKIIGAKELWTFNTKNKILTVFRSAEEAGLMVRGTSIVNYDQNNSFSKRTGRKPESYIKEVLEGGKVSLRKLTDKLKKDAALAHRINQHTILLRVIL